MSYPFFSCSSPTLPHLSKWHHHPHNHSSQKRRGYHCFFPPHSTPHMQSIPSPVSLTFKMHACFLNLMFLSVCAAFSLVTAISHLDYPNSLLLPSQFPPLTPPELILHTVATVIFSTSKSYGVSSLLKPTASLSVAPGRGASCLFFELNQECFCLEGFACTLPLPSIAPPPAYPVPPG